MSKSSEPKSPAKMLVWEKMASRHPASHLVTGVYHFDRMIDPVKLLQRLIIALPAKGDWSIRRHSDGGKDKDVVQIALEKEDDALRVSETLGARPGGSHPGWKSQRVFGFTAELADAVKKALMMT